MIVFEGKFSSVSEKLALCIVFAIGSGLVLFESG